MEGREGCRGAPVVTMLSATGLLLGGLVLLALGGELLVRAGTGIARLAGLTPAVIGLTVLAMGTSLPELVVSLMAAVDGRGSLALGNVLGSNIFNITACLGLTALVVALPVHSSAVRLEWPVMFAASAVCVLFVRDALIDRHEGSFLVLCLVLFTAYSVRLARREVSGMEAREYAEAVEGRRLPGPGRQGLAAAVGLGLGLALLVVGARLLITGAVGIARLAGLTERVIALTVVAAGTGMPEVATSIVAAVRRQTDVAVANMIGSNLFNLLGILGVTSLVHPIQFAPEMAGTDTWWMLGTAFLLLPLLIVGRRISRIEGALLIGVYTAYVALLL